MMALSSSSSSSTAAATAVVFVATTRTRTASLFRQQGISTQLLRRQQQPQQFLQLYSTYSRCTFNSFHQPQLNTITNNSCNIKLTDYHVVRRHASTMSDMGNNNKSNNINGNNNIVTTTTTTPSTTASTSSSSSSSSTSSYVSPFQEIFDTIQEGKTFLGTTEFHPPHIKLLKCGIPEHVLRFKTTTYGRLLEEPFVRPMEHRVILQVPMKHIAPLLSESEIIVFQEIVGTRYNPVGDILQLSSCQFGSRIENKRHVVSMLERIIETTKTLAQRVEEEVGVHLVK